MADINLPTNDVSPSNTDANRVILYPKGKNWYYKGSDNVEYILKQPPPILNSFEFRYTNVQSNVGTLSEEKDRMYISHYAGSEYNIAIGDNEPFAKFLNALSGTDTPIRITNGTEITFLRIGAELASSADEKKYRTAFEPRGKYTTNHIGNINTTNFPLDGDGNSTKKFMVAFPFAIDGVAGDNAFPTIARIFGGVFKRTNHTDWPSTTVQATQRYVNITSSTKSGVDWQLVFLAIPDLIDFFAVVHAVDGRVAVQLGEHLLYYEIVNLNQQGFGTGRFSVDLKFTRYNPSEVDIFASLDTFLPVTDNVSTATFQLKSTQPEVSFPLMEDYPATNYKSLGSWENQTETDFNATTSYNTDPTYLNPFLSRAGKFSATYDSASKRYTIKIARHSQHANSLIENRDAFLKNIKNGQFLHCDYMGSTSTGNETFIIISASFESEANPIYTFVTERVRIKGNKAPIGNWVLSPSISNRTSLTQSERSIEGIVNSLEDLSGSNKLAPAAIKNLIPISEIRTNPLFMGALDLATNNETRVFWNFPDHGTPAVPAVTILANGNVLATDSSITVTNEILYEMSPEPDINGYTYSPTIFAPGVMNFGIIDLRRIYSIERDRKNEKLYAIGSVINPSFVTEFFLYEIPLSGDDKGKATYVDDTVVDFGLTGHLTVSDMVWDSANEKMVVLIRTSSAGNFYEYEMNLTAGTATRIGTDELIPSSIVSSVNPKIGSWEGIPVLFHRSSVTSEERVFELNTTTGKIGKLIKHDPGFGLEITSAVSSDDGRFNYIAKQSNTGSESNLFIARQTLRGIDTPEGRMDIHQRELASGAGYSLPTVELTSNLFYLIADSGTDKAGPYISTGTAWTRIALGSDVYKPPTSFYDATYSKVSLGGGTNQGWATVKGVNNGVSNYQRFTIIAFTDTTAAELAAQSQGGSSNYLAVAITEANRTFNPATGHHFVLTGTGKNCYKVPVGQAGTYQVAGFFRVDDSSSFGSDAAEKTLGVGIHASSADNSGFLWAATRVQSRTRLLYSRVIDLNAGDLVRLFIWTDDDAKVNSFEYSVVRIG